MAEKGQLGRRPHYSKPTWHTQFSRIVIMTEGGITLDRTPEWPSDVLVLHDPGPGLEASSFLFYFGSVPVLIFSQHQRLGGHFHFMCWLRVHEQCLFL